MRVHIPVSHEAEYKNGSTVLSDSASFTERDLLIFGRIPMILFLIEFILLMKNPIKSSLLIVGSTEL